MRNEDGVRNENGARNEDELRDQQVTGRHDRPQATASKRSERRAQTGEGTKEERQEGVADHDGIEAAVATRIADAAVSGAATDEITESTDASAVAAAAEATRPATELPTQATEPLAVNRVVESEGSPERIDIADRTIEVPPRETPPPALRAVESTEPQAPGGPPVGNEGEAATEVASAAVATQRAGAAVVPQAQARQATATVPGEPAGDDRFAAIVDAGATSAAKAAPLDGAEGVSAQPDEGASVEPESGKAEIGEHAVAAKVQATSETSVGDDGDAAGLDADNAPFDQARGSAASAPGPGGDSDDGASGGGTRNHHSTAETAHLATGTAERAAAGRAGGTPAGSADPGGRSGGANAALRAEQALAADTERGALVRFRDGGEMRLSIEPAGLGEIELRIAVRDSGVHAHLAAADRDVRELLAQSRADLAHALGRHNLRLDSFDVDAGARHGQAFGDREARADRGPVGIEGSEIGAREPQDPAARPRVLPGGSLSIHA